MAYIVMASWIDGPLVASLAAYIFMAYMVMAYIILTYIAMASVVMASIAMAYTVTAHIVMAYIVIMRHLWLATPVIGRNYIGP